MSTPMRVATLASVLYASTTSKSVWSNTSASWAAVTATVWGWYQSSVLNVSSVGLKLSLPSIGAWLLGVCRAAATVTTVSWAGSASRLTLTSALLPSSRSSELTSASIPCAALVS